MSETTLTEARAAKIRALEVFSRLASVVGVGIARIDGGYGLKINLREAPEKGVALPETVDGVSVRVEVVGPIQTA